MRAQVDEDVCAGHGVCTAICPDVFVLDDDMGFARVIVGVIPVEHESAAREAELRCPARAIHLM